MCYTYCNEACAAYMATQHGDECWCSVDGQDDSDDWDYGRHGQGACDMSCAGDDADICGGDWVSF